jgi:hypothetical protein
MRLKTRERAGHIFFGGALKQLATLGQEEISGSFMERLHDAKLCELFAIEMYIELFKVAPMRQRNARLNLR